MTDAELRDKLLELLGRSSSPVSDSILETWLQQDGIVVERNRIWVACEQMKKDQHIDLHMQVFRAGRLFSARMRDSGRLFLQYGGYTAQQAKIDEAEARLDAAEQEEKALRLRELAIAERSANSDDSSRKATWIATIIAGLALLLTLKQSWDSRQSDAEISAVKLELRRVHLQLQKLSPGQQQTKFQRDSLPTRKTGGK